MNTMREEFEAWAAREFGFGKIELLRNDDDSYRFRPAHETWRTWQAARQPVGEAVAWQVKDEDSDWEWAWADKGVYLMVKRHRPHHARELFTTPPQQPERVDLSAFRELAETWKVMAEPDPDKQAWAMHHANCCCADELIALTYQQESKP